MGKDKGLIYKSSFDVGLGRRTFLC